MKKLILLLFTVMIAYACSTRKQVERAVNTGNYDHAIQTALKKLRTNKDKKRNQDYVIMLQDAYYKVVERDLGSIAHLKKDNNPEAYRNIYELYTGLDGRQESIKPLIPLYIDDQPVVFEFNNYSDAILDAKNKVSSYYYQKGLALLNAKDKQSIREAYNTLEYIENINPNYKDTPNLLNEAHERGTDYILVSINNETEQMIPEKLEADLLSMDTYGINKFWSVYHVNKIKDLNYDYTLQLNLKQINVSPERITEREFVREKEVKDGWQYAYDEKGNVAKDSLGNDIKVDKIVKVTCRYFETIQTKTSQVIGDVVYKDLKTNQILDKFPVNSEFVFEYIFATSKGDRRALLPDDIGYLEHRRVPFPNNEQMVYDTGEDLKLKLKQIINSYRI
ncbi:hypothetical protein KFZ70_15890 [Tamlana fucoidanivorans]|uniref:Lipoprotein n=1 Tax=Allotamlana fucoidanivorans TaxID=2583814 RepID=A0A5C4SJ78_9FLAO|nr:hypothetical protein [Tamlana fucoidanivorans]TNJ42976.1 hypothetical protein FGF67_13385 [Tamlana fucoidanivorans]